MRILKLISLAAKRPLGIACVGESTPVPLISKITGVTKTLGFPCLIKGLKVEDIETPIKSCANTALVEGLRIHSPSLRCTIILATYTVN